METQTRMSALEKPEVTSTMKISRQVILMLVGAVLILINAAWTAAQGGAIIVSSYQVNSTQDFSGDWGRIVLGIPSVIGGSAIYLWLMIAVLNLVLVAVFYFRPQKRSYVGLSILTLSLLSVTVGGGFIVGMILVAIGSAGAIENKPFRETLLGQILRGARLDSKLFEGMEERAKNLRTATLVIVFLNILTGLGNGLYVLTANKILEPSSSGASDILLKGNVPLDSSVLGVIGTYLGLGVIKWLVLSAIVFFVATKIAGVAAKYNTVACGVSLAYAPTALQLFMPLVFFNQPMLTGTWPLAFFFLSNIWMGIALTFAIMKSLNLNLGRAAGITITAASAYYALNYILIDASFPITAVRFVIQPIVTIEAMLTVSILIGLALGAFPRHEQSA
jgi:hypothetical protein